MTTPTMKLYDGKRPVSVYESVFLLAQEHDYRLRRSVLRAASKAVARLWREGKLTRKREKSRRWVVRKADVLTALDAKPTPRRNADETIADAIARTTDKTGARHLSDPKSGPLKFSDDEQKRAPERGNQGDLSAYHERRRYRRNGR